LSGTHLPVRSLRSAQEQQGKSQRMPACDKEKSDKCQLGKMPACVKTGVGEEAPSSPWLP